MNRPSASRRAMFTLTEMLIVIAIIAVLAALLCPSLRKAIERTDIINCQNNQHQVHAVAEAYAADHRGFYASRNTLNNPCGEGLTLQLMCFVKGFEKFPPGTNKNTLNFKIPWFNCPSDKIPLHQLVCVTPFTDNRMSTYQQNNYAFDQCPNGLLKPDRLVCKQADRQAPEKVIFLAESSGGGGVWGNASTFMLEPISLWSVPTDYSPYCVPFQMSFASFHNSNKLGMNVLLFDGRSKLIENVITDFNELFSTQYGYFAY